MPTQPIPPKPFTGWAVYDIDGIPGTFAATKTDAITLATKLFEKRWNKLRANGVKCRRVTVTLVEGSK